MDGPDPMPKIFYIVRDDRGWWYPSDQDFPNETGRSYPSPREAMDHLNNHLRGEGLIMGWPVPSEYGFRVEAYGPGEKVPDNRPMLYSAESLKTIEAIRERIGDYLKKYALGMARQDGRHLVTDDDVWDAFERLSKTDIFPDDDEETKDGR